MITIPAFAQSSEESIGSVGLYAASLGMTIFIVIGIPVLIISLIVLKKKGRLTNKITKKILLGAGVLFVGMIIFGVTSTFFQSDEELAEREAERIADEKAAKEQSIQQAKQSEEPKPIGKKDNPAKIGDPFLVGNFAFRVLETSTAKSVGSSLFGTKADGVFIIIDFAIENRGKESTDLYSDVFRLIDSKNRKFDTDNEAWIHLEKNVFLKQLQPSLPIRGQIIFDVPPQKENYILEISPGLFGFDKKYVSLGTLG